MFMTELQKNLKLKDAIFSEEEISTKIKQVADQITDDYKDKEEQGIIALCVLKGASFFFTDLVRQIKLQLFLDFVAASSYQNSMKSSGKIKILKDINFDVKGKHILLVEDVLDSGLTLDYLYNLYKSRGAASVEICVLLNKDLENTKDFVKYSCFKCPDEFVVGYGIDCAEMFRHLPYIASVEQQDKE